jgi:hypothetical protein
MTEDELQEHVANLKTTGDRIKLHHTLKTLIELSKIKDKQTRALVEAALNVGSDIIADHEQTMAYMSNAGTIDAINTGILSSISTRLDASRGLAKKYGFDT